MLIIQTGVCSGTNSQFLVSEEQFPSCIIQLEGGGGEGEGEGGGERECVLAAHNGYSMCARWCLR